MLNPIAPLPAVNLWCLFKKKHKFISQHSYNACSFHNEESWYTFVPEADHPRQGHRDDFKLNNFQVIMEYESINPTGIKSCPQCR